eukprot:TRINITY_DN9884_c0_g1_i1.p1 TRINITY_DN9884_c0_g1~~TRINITY_DN9884_c0_g1_i1.p1  ORF type:complete len:212 (+),score=34.63 TRINITY_DN9884_c0_g1_i1:67-702(+)
MALTLGDTAPNFISDSSQGKIDFYEYAGDSWIMFFSHPADFTPVCTTELGTVASLSEEWSARDVKPIALSVDSAESHVRWIGDINEVMNCQVDFPIVADEDRSVAMLYGMIAPDAPLTMQGQLTVRRVFLIDPNKKIRWVITYPAATGRNFDEILRCIDAIQLTDTRKVATPANWKHGDNVVILPSVPNDEATELFGDYDTVKPYLRYTQI